VFEPLNEDEGQVLEEIRAQLSRAPADGDWTIIGRWFLADPSTRTISPFSKITVLEYNIENRINENTPASLDEAERLAVGNAELLQRIAQARKAITEQTPPSAGKEERPAADPNETLKMQEEALALHRKENGPEHPETLTAMNNLANAYSKAGRMGAALPLWLEASSRLPKDTQLALKIAALQVWFGKDADHAATSRRMLELAAGTDNPSTAERAAKAYCLRPSSDPQLIESAVTLARRAAELGKDHPYLEWYQMALGMAEYRHGNYPAADQALRAAEETVKGGALVQSTARLYHAMSLFQQGKEVEARQLFDKAVAQMKPLPTDEKQPLANGADADNVILWLAYKEAKALLKPNPNAAPVKR
jgi:tetratricopeptide (TPR) repeat protein